MGGVCEGKLQRRGDRPLRCRKLDLEELHFTVRGTLEAAARRRPVAETTRTKPVGSGKAGWS